MRLVADLHTHTVASTHASSTLQEMVRAAKKQGLQAMAVTDHGVGLKDSPVHFYFKTITRIPYIVEGDFLLLKGVEANVMGADGTLDMDEWPEILKGMDWVIASVHGFVPAMNREEATQMWLRIAKHPDVDMIGHSEQEKYRYDYDTVTKAFAENNKVMEMNANSAVARPGGEENLRKLALACKANGTKVAVNSDAHSVYELGNGGTVLEMLDDIGFPEELVVNSSMGLLLEELALHQKPVIDKLEDILFPG